MWNPECTEQSLRGQKPQNWEKRVSESKILHFPSPQQRARFESKVPISPVAACIEMDFFDSKCPFLEWGECGFLDSEILFSQYWAFFGLPRKQKIAVHKFWVQESEIGEECRQFWTWILGVNFLGDLKPCKNQAEKFAIKIRGAIKIRWEIRQQFS